MQKKHKIEQNKKFLILIRIRNIIFDIEIRIRIEMGGEIQAAEAISLYFREKILLEKKGDESSWRATGTI